MWLKEYLLAAHSKVLGGHLLDLSLPVYHKIWESAVLRDWTRADLSHVLLHGAAPRLIKRCQAEGTCVVGEAVCGHPDVVNRILAPEYERLNMQYRRFDKIWEYMRQEYTLCTHILVPSNWVAKSLVEFGIHPEKLIKLPYPSGTDKKQKGNRAAKGKGRTIRVLCVAGLSVIKGQHYLLEAVAHLNRRNARVKFEVTLVGASGKDYLVRLSRIGMPFEHIEHIPNADMIDFMSGFDVFALPSLADGFAVAVSEALQAGIPAVTTQNNGAADAIVEGENGYVVPAQDHLALANAIAAAVDVTPDPGFVAPDQVLDWQTYAARLAQIYGHAVGQADGLGSEVVTHSEI
ncbi:hypothetical protein CO709_29260 [Burkholderia thailandensis]|nr:hypothetical protein CO709_29260 [Burkholderia thailandensis]